MNTAKLNETLEDLFNFDVLGPTMMKLRKNLDDGELQDKLTAILKAAAQEKLGIADGAELAEIEAAAKARVLQFVAAAKAGKGKGCG